MNPITIPALFTAAAAFIACVYKAQTWDYETPLRKARAEERSNAPRVVQCLLNHFDKLDPQGTGLITIESLPLVDELEASESDKRLMRLAIENAGPHSFVAANPWLFASSHELELQRVGHKIGVRQETMVASGGAAGAWPITMNVDVHAISRADLSTYVARVNSAR